MAGKASIGTGDPQGDVPANILIVEARYYEDVGAALMKGAVAELEAYGASYDVVSVPGALEIPQVVAMAVGYELTALNGLSPDGLYDGIVVLGCVIRGETSHYDIVCNHANHWLMDTVTNSGVPLGNAILTVDNKEQAMARATAARNGKGGDAVRACLRLVELAHDFAEKGLKAQGLDIDLDDLDPEELENLEEIAAQFIKDGRNGKN